MQKFRRFVRSTIFPGKETPAHACAEAPKLKFDEIFSPNMNLGGLNNLLLDSDSADKQNNAPPVAPAASPAATSAHLSTPTRHQPMTPNGDTTPSNPDTDTSQTSSNPNTPGSGPGKPAWSSGIGHATTAGKSGRVIEKLMADVDRLKREKNLATVKLDEEVKRGESARSALENLRVSKESLESMHDVDKTMLARKGRKLEEVRVDLEAERVRRVKAESEVKETRQERDQTVEKLMRELAEEREQSKRASSQYEVLSKSWKSLDENYGRQTSRLKVDFKKLQQERIEDKGKVAKLEIIVEQLQKESEKSDRAKERLLQDFEEYKAEKEDSIRELREKAERNDAANEQALQQMNTVLGEMRYVVNVRRDVRDID